MRNGGRQDDPLSSLLLHFVSEKSQPAIQINPEGTVCNRLSHPLAYADHFYLLNKTEIVHKISKEKLGLKINLNKIK